MRSHSELRPSLHNPSPWRYGPDCNAAQLPGLPRPVECSALQACSVLYMHIFIPGCGVSWIETVFFFLGGRGGVLPVELYGGGRKGGGRFFFTLNDLIAVSIFETSLQLHHTYSNNTPISDPTHQYHIPHVHI